MYYKDSSDGDNKEDSNIQISYGSSEDVGEGSEFASNYAGTNSAVELGSVGFTGPSAQTLCYYIKIQLISEDNDAEFSGSFQWIFEEVNNQ